MNNAKQTRTNIFFIKKIHSMLTRYNEFNTLPGNIFSNIDMKNYDETGGKLVKRKE